MTDKHPITSPPKELLDKWEGEWHHYQGQYTYFMFMAEQAAQWGADQELDACCEWLKGYTSEHIAIYFLRETRRPKLLSLKEEALKAAQRFYANGHEGRTDEELTDDFHTIRRALGAL